MPERMTSRWYVGNYVKIMDQGGNHSKKIFFAFIYTAPWQYIDLYNSDRDHIFRFISSALVDHHAGTKTPPTCLGVGFQDQAIREDAVAFMEPDLGMDLPRELFHHEIPGESQGFS